MEKISHIIPLDAIEDHRVDLVGPKALNLARMKRIGLPVPPGFCITAAAYREHLKSGNIALRIDAALNLAEKASPGELPGILFGIRGAIVAYPLSAKIREAIRVGYEALGEAVVAVRSSATAEDLPEGSFAGQYDTYLGISTLAECLRSVKRCWASLWTERAFDYRTRNRVEHHGIEMAVIVQKLVPAEASGVAFTADPVTGRSDRLILEAGFGLGEAIVKGRIAPDRFVLSKSNLRVLDRMISEKVLEVVPASEGGVLERIVPPPRTRQPCLNRGTIKRLGRLAVKVEKLLGGPQDIEWAVCDGEVFLLQSRPITALPFPGERPWEDRQVWTNANTGEVAPDVVTPLTWSIIHPAARSLFAPVFSLISVRLGDHPIFGLVGGRIYFNVNTLAGVVRHLPRRLGAGIDGAFGGEQGRMFETGELTLPDEDLPDLRFSLPMTILKSPLSFLRLLVHSPKRGDCFVDRIYRQAMRLRRLELASLDEGELVSHLTQGAENLCTFLNGSLYVVRAVGGFPILMACCRKWLGDVNARIANGLLAGSGSVDTAEAGHALWRLAEEAHRVPLVEKAILAGESWGGTRAAICGLREGDRFLKSWDRFMERHGHHARGELELFNPRWSETPDYILGLLRGYLDSLGRNDPLDRYRRRAEEREELVAECRRRLRNPVKRMIFNGLLADSQRGAAMRENAKSEPMRFWAELRRIALELGRRFARRGAFESPEDIFFLKLEELDAARREEPAFDATRVVAGRRAEYEKNKSITPPKVVVGIFDPENFVPDVVDTSVEVFTGIPVSPGVVTGKARVILKADMNEHLAAGEILVAPFTDPGWTPYFVPAAAIVMDQGGLLSHGSIIAREYGIPAVVNVGPATKVIRTGQLIRVDGDSGRVTILR